MNASDQPFMSPEDTEMSAENNNQVEQQMDPVERQALVERLTALAELEDNGMSEDNDAETENSSPKPKM